MDSSFKIKKGKLELLTDTDMLLMAEEGIRSRICHVIHQYAKANNKYMKDFDKNKDHNIIRSYKLGGK